MIASTSSAFDAVAGFWLPRDRAAPHLVVPVEDGEWPRARTSPGAAETVVVGCGPRVDASPLLATVRDALARELALLRGRLRGLEARRLDPPHWRGSELRDRVRRVLLAGAVLRSASRSCPSVLDTVLDGLDVGSVRRIRAGYDGSLLVQAEPRDGDPLIVRFGRVGAGTDPRGGAAALRELEAAGVGPAPRFRGDGVVRDVAWSAETRMPGRRMERLDRTALLDILSVCRSLPRADRGPGCLREDLSTLADRFPRWREPLEAVAERCARELDGIPGVLRHGDLWTGNLLVRGGRLSGVVDWEAWHPAGVPGTDLLHLLAARRLLEGATMAELWLRRPWMDRRFRELLVDSRPELSEADLSSGLLEAIGVAWWSGLVASKLHRFPAYADRPGWAREHVDTVAARIPA